MNNKLQITAKRGAIIVKMIPIFISPHIILVGMEKYTSVSCQKNRDRMSSGNTDSSLLMETKNNFIPSNTDVTHIEKKCVKSCLERFLAASKKINETIAAPKQDKKNLDTVKFRLCDIIYGVKKQFF
ncbi:hypothetical protein HZS_3856 [Henneguya salminicola]|nr:hypothetical protein HZS_3856 [Henneguya salminicola]